MSDAAVGHIDEDHPRLFSCHLRGVVQPTRHFASCISQILTEAETGAAAMFGENRWIADQRDKGIGRALPNGLGNLAQIVGNLGVVTLSCGLRPFP